MTETILGLLVDDNRQNLDRVSTRLNLYLRREGWEVRWTLLDDPDDADEAIRRLPEFNLVVIDLLFPRHDSEMDEARGLELIELASRELPKSYIFAISEGDLRRHDLFSEAKLRGANKVVRRAEFSVESATNSPAAIAADIRRHLVENGTVTEVAVDGEEGDLAVQTLLFEVQGPTLGQLHRKILSPTGDTARRVRVRHLSPGASGAQVCETKAEVRRGRTVHHVLKISRAYETLAAEARRALQARQVLQSRFVVPILPEHPVGPVNGWYATGAPCDQAVITLREWLGAGPGERQTEELFEVLFTECLGSMYRSNMEEREGDPLARLAMPEYKRRLVLQGMAELVPVLTRPEGGGLAASCELALRDDLVAFTMENRLNGVSARAWPTTTLVTQAHGDLHGGNILLYRGKYPAPALIDFSDFGEAHWASDVARLVVDLVMRAVDAGPDSMFFTGFPIWRRLLAAIGDLSPDLVAVSAEPRTRAALAGLRWLVRNLRQVCPPLTDDDSYARHRWEWHMALCVFLLRSIYHHTIPGPKRAVALLAAHDQLVAGVARLSGK